VDVLVLQHGTCEHKVKSTTHYADLNELACAYVINSERWWNSEAQALFESKIKLVPRDDATIQCSRGKVMGERLRAEWLGNTGKPLKFTEIHWCARNPKSILPTCSEKHPADILLRLNGDSWLGVSAKSRDSKNIASGLKNPGLSTIASMVGLPPLNSTVQESWAFINFEHPELLNKNHTELKAIIRADKGLQAFTRAEGSKVAVRVRDAVLEACVRLPSERLNTFIRSTLLDCGQETSPPYVRLVGYGDGSPNLPFGSTIFDPWKIRTDGVLTAVAVGDQAVGFKNDYERICKLRVKWESEPFASTLKFSVDEWEN
jgi:hypothetical protein